jgi:hypothetical protein
MPVSALSTTELQRIIDRLRIAHAQTLVHLPLEEILTSIDQVVARLLDPASPARQEAEAYLPEETGLSPAMIRHTLPLIFHDYRAEKLAALLDEELGDRRCLDAFVAQGGKTRRAYGPVLTAHVLAGNLPGAGLDGVIFSLLVKSAVLAKTSSSSAFLPTFFARTLAEVHPALGACLAVTTWPGGSVSLEELAFSQAEVVVASGNDDSLCAIRRRVHGRFLGYGHKISFSLIDKGSLTDAQPLARRVAYDVALFDQQGCLSPQLLYVEAGGAVSPQQFAALLAAELAAWQTTLPRGRVSAEASTAIRRARDEAEWQALAGKDVVLYASAAGTDWTVIYDADPTFLPSPLFRTIRVKAVPSLLQLSDILTPWRSYLEAVGVALTPERLPIVTELLGKAGVSRICPLGAMQTPPLSWRHGGRPRLADLVRWAEQEPTT